MFLSFVLVFLAVSFLFFGDDMRRAFSNRRWAEATAAKAREDVKAKGEFLLGLYRTVPNLGMEVVGRVLVGHQYSEDYYQDGQGYCGYIWESALAKAANPALQGVLQSNLEGRGSLDGVFGFYYGSQDERTVVNFHRLKGVTCPFEAYRLAMG